MRHEGLEVTLVTPANEVSTWTTHTEEQHRIQARVLGLGIGVWTGTTLAGVNGGSVILESVHTGTTSELEAANVVMVTSREPLDRLHYALGDRIPIQRIGDCLAPGTIATAVYSGHRYAREADAEASVGPAFVRE